MVIQRNWKTPSSSATSTDHSISSSDDENNSWHTLSNSTNSNGQNKLVNFTSATAPIQSHSTLLTSGSSSTSGGGQLPSVGAAASKTTICTPQMAESVHKALKDRYNGRTHMNQTNWDSAIRAMELIRLNLQDAFDKEIDQIVSKYVDNFFKPALKNIKENLGESCVTVDYIQKVSCSLLENSKVQYYKAATTAITTPIITPSLMSLTTSSGKNINTLIKTEPSQSKISSVKRARDISLPPSQKDQMDTMSDNINSSTILATSSPSIKRAAIISPANSNMNTLNRIIMSGGGVGGGGGGGGSSGGINCSGGVVARTKQVFWNVSNLNADTLFVLDYKANRALGFLDNSKERLASKHPELIRYLPDLIDKEWLCQQKIISPITKPNRFLLLVYSEVYKISQTDDDYRQKGNINELQGFKVPDFILQKMKIFFTELSLKSQSLYISSAGNGQQLQQQQQQQQQHQHQQSQQTISIVVSQCQRQPSNTISSATGSILANAISGNNNSTLKTALKSSLSSSHATLSALLSNPTNSSNGLDGMVIGGSGTVGVTVSNNSSNEATFNMLKKE